MADCQGTTSYMNFSFWVPSLPPTHHSRNPSLPASPIHAAPPRILYNYRSLPTSSSPLYSNLHEQWKPPKIVMKALANPQSFLQHVLCLHQEENRSTFTSYGTQSSRSSSNSSHSVPLCIYRIPRENMQDLIEQIVCIQRSCSQCPAIPA